MQRKQNFKKIRAKKGDARTEFGEVKEKLNLSVTPTAKSKLTKAATAHNISVSELIERYGRNLNLLETLLDAVEDLIDDAVSTEECLPPHPSYEVSGEAVRKLTEAFNAFVESEQNL